MVFNPLQINIRRYKDIAKLFIKYGFSDIVFQSVLKESLEQDEEEAAQENPKVEELPRDLERLGPTFIKLGQFLSAFTDILPTPYQASLTRLQDQAEPYPYEDVEKIVAEDLGIKIENAFTYFDTEPISAASIAQVHKAELRSGRIVAVKVQRPGIRKDIFSDLEAIHFVADLLDKHTSFATENYFSNLADQFRKNIMRELDFRLEAQNLKMIRENLKEFDEIFVPEPIDSFTGNRVLTMDFVEGTKISNIKPLPQSKIDHERLAERLFEAYLKQVLIDGFFHADPHPGNVLITNDGKIALLDLGMVAHLGDDLQDILLKILLGISEGNGRKVAYEALKIAQKKPDYNEHQLVMDIEDIVAYQQHRTVEHFHTGQVMLEISKIARRNGVTIPIELTILGKTLLNLDQVGQELSPSFDPNACIRSNATSLMQNRLFKTLSIGKVLGSVMETKEFVTKLPQRVNQILDTIARNELTIHVESIDEELLIGGIQKVANRIAIGLILAAIIVGAALIMNIDTDFTLLGYPAIAMIFFLIATIGGLALVAKIFLSDRNIKRKK